LVWVGNKGLRQWVMGQWVGGVGVGGRSWRGGKVGVSDSDWGARGSGIRGVWGWGGGGPAVYDRAGAGRKRVCCCEGRYRNALWRWCGG